jgi:hypothetical protein
LSIKGGGIMTQYYQGDTIRLQATFRDFSGSLVNPSSVTVTFYNCFTSTEISSVAATSNNPSTGVFYTDYQIPTDKTGVVYEFKGKVSGTTALARKQIRFGFVF